MRYRLESYLNFNHGVSRVPNRKTKEKAISLTILITVANVRKLRYCVKVVKKVAAQNRTLRKFGIIQPNTKGLFLQGAKVLNTSRIVTAQSEGSKSYGFGGASERGRTTRVSKCLVGQVVFKKITCMFSKLTIKNMLKLRLLI